MAYHSSPSLTIPDTSTKKLNRLRFASPILNRTVADSLGMSVSSGPASIACLLPTPPAPSAAVTSVFPLVNVLTIALIGIRTMSLLLFVRSATIIKLPAGPPGTELEIKEGALDHKVHSVVNDMLTEDCRPDSRFPSTGHGSHSDYLRPAKQRKSRVFRPA